MTKIAVGVRVEETSLNKLDELTKIFGSTRSDLIDTVTGVLTSFDIDFLKTLQGFSKGTRIPEYLIIQNIMASWFARRDAETQVNGYNSPVLNEFLYDGERPMSFEDLYNNLKANYIKDFEREKDEELLRTESFAPDYRKLAK